MLDLKTIGKPASPEEAVRLFSETPGSGLYVAGGTVIVPAASPNLDYLIDLMGAGLDYLRIVDRGADPYLAIGATTRVADLARSQEVEELASGVLRDAALAVANHTIRNSATVGGNIASWAFPTDLPPALLALDSRIVLLNPDGRRELGLREFYDRRRDVYFKGDLIVEVRVPTEPDDLSGAFETIGRKRLDVAVVNCAAALAAEGGVIRDVRVALNGVAPTPVRATDAESFLVGKEAAHAIFVEAGRLVSAALSPRSDHRAGGDYRRKTAAVVVRRALARAAGLPGA